MAFSGWFLSTNFIELKLILMQKSENWGVFGGFYFKIRRVEGFLEGVFFGGLIFKIRRVEGFLEGVFSGGFGGKTLPSAQA